MRVLCPKCVVSYQLDEAAFKDLDARYGASRVTTAQATGLNGIPTLYRATGCAECMHTGYKGRTALFEILEVTDLMRELIQQRAPAGVLREQAIHEGMITMFQDGFAKCLAGKTTLEEVLKAALE